MAEAVAVGASIRNRALYGVAQKERVTAAMTLTTSYFSKDATDFAADIRYQLQLKDFIDLKLLLAPYGTGLSTR